MFNVTAMERSILAELSERGGRGQLSRLKDRRPLERLVNKGFVERHALKGQQEEYVLTAIGKKVLDNSRLERRSARDSIDHRGRTD
jgi:DNA-binding HxlR family transcriptional regulator